MKTQSTKLTLGALGFGLLLNPASAAVVSLPIAQIPTELKTGFQYGLGILFMVGFPEIDAKLDAFIGENPKLAEYYTALSKEELIRKLMLGKMQRSEYTNQRNQEIVAWVEENPDIKAKVEQRIRNVPPENRERAFITAAKSLALNQTVQSRGVTP